jgi:hypothetical protein
MDRERPSRGAGGRRPTLASPELAAAEERQAVASLLAGLERVEERAVVLRTDGIAREDARLGVGREEPKVRPEEDLCGEGMRVSKRSAARRHAAGLTWKTQPTTSRTQRLATHISTISE